MKITVFLIVMTILIALSISGVSLYYGVALTISDWLGISTVLVFLESIWVTVLIFLLREGRREKRERRRELEGYLENHSGVLVNEVLKKWFESKAADITIVGAREFAYSTPLAKAYYKPHFKSRIQEPTEPQLKYVDQAIEHLKYYADVWNRWLDCKNLVKNHLEKAVKMWESIEETLVRNIPTKFIGWDAKGTIPSTCYILDNTVWEIYTEARYFTASGKLLGVFKIIPEKDYFRVGVATLYAKSSDEGLLNEFTNIVDAIIRDESLLEQLKSLNEERNLIEGDVKDFQVALDKIIDDFENGHINLEGSCWRCKPWRDK